MESLLTYILQVNLLLSLLFLGYHFLLKGLTFYSLNRVYFVLGAVYAFVYPFLNIRAWFAEKIDLPKGEVLAYLPFDLEETQSSLALSDLLAGLLLLGAAVFALKLIFQLLSLFRIHWHSKPAQWRDYLFRNVVFPITPFSFFNKIYLHQQQHEELELNDIFKHEYIHVKGQHSVDVLLFEFVLISCWYNPFVWLMRRAVRQNLEFLTDQQVLDKGVDRQTYQYSLLNVTKQGARVGISNQFNFNTLKKRIMMMNKKRSSKLELSKYAFMLPMLIVAGITFSVSQAEGKIEVVVDNLKQADVGKMLDEVVVNLPKIGAKDTVKEVKRDTVQLKKIAYDPSVNMVVSGKASYVSDVDGSNKRMVIVKPDNFKLNYKNKEDRPQFFVNGKEVNEEAELEKIDPKNILTVEIYNPTDGTTKTDKGKVYITLKGGEVENSNFDALKGRHTKTFSVSIGSNSGENKQGDPEVKKLNINGVGTTGEVSKLFFRNQEGQPKIRINGSKVGSGGEPLIVVDGSPVSSWEGIETHNIESITVLKDKSSTALYGDRGKDGVILITTKLGFNGLGKVAKDSIPSLQGRIKEVVVTGFKKFPGDANPIRINRRLIKEGDYTEFLNNLPEKAVYYLDGKEVKAGKLSRLDVKDIKEVAYIPDETAKHMFGDKASEGAVSVMTK